MLMSLLLPFEIRSVLYDLYMHLELDIPLPALSLYLCTDIYLEDYRWKWKWGKDGGSISTCFTGWGRTSNNLICYLFIKGWKEDSFCHLKSRALWITKLRTVTVLKSREIKSAIQTDPQCKNADNSDLSYILVHNAKT